MKPTAYQKHLKNAQNKKHVWTELEIIAARMQIHKAPQDEAMQLIMELNEEGPLSPGYAITKEQTEKGLAFLKENLFTKNGAVRNNHFARCFGEFEVACIRDFKKFTFQGVRYIQNHYSLRFQTTPIYRVHNSKGEYFDYTMTFQGLPEVTFKYIIYTSGQLPGEINGSRK